MIRHIKNFVDKDTLLPRITSNAARRRAVVNRMIKMQLTEPQLVDSKLFSDQYINSVGKNLEG